MTMKTFLIFLLFFIAKISFSQTEIIEKENIANRYQNGEFTIEKYQQYGKDWRALIEDLGGYPNLPYDNKSQIIKFEYVIETEMSKKIIYDRILEWSAISFGSLSDVPTIRILRLVK